MHHVPRTSQRHPTSQVWETKNRGIEWLATADGHVRRSLREKQQTFVGCRLNSFDGFHWKTALMFSQGSCESIVDLYKANQIQDHSVFPARQSHAVDPKWTIDLTRCTAWPTGSQIWGPFQISKGENNIWGPFQIPKEEISSIPHTGLKYLIYNCYFHFYFGISWAR